MNKERMCIYKIECHQTGIIIGFEEVRTLIVDLIAYNKDRIIW